jgi:hypothetical protein
MMTLIDCKMAVVGYEVRDLAMSREALNECDVDDPGWLPAATTDDPDILRFNFEERSQTRNPLVHQLTPVHKNERVARSASDEGSGYDSLAEGGRGRQNAGVMPSKSFSRH